MTELDLKMQRKFSEANKGLSDPVVQKLLNRLERAELEVQDLNTVIDMFKADKLTARATAIEECIAAATKARTKGRSTIAAMRQLNGES